LKRGKGRRKKRKRERKSHELVPIPTVLALPSLFKGKEGKGRAEGPRCQGALVSNLDAEKRKKKRRTKYGGLAVLKGGNSRGAPFYSSSRQEGRKDSLTSALFPKRRLRSFDDRADYSKEEKGKGEKEG